MKGAGLGESDAGLSLQSVNLSLSGGWGVRSCAEPGESFCRIIFCKAQRGRRCPSCFAILLSMGNGKRLASVSSGAVATQTPQSHGWPAKAAQPNPFVTFT